MAIYGRDYYGRSKYGGSLRIEMAVAPFRAQSRGYDAVALSWRAPGGEWGGFRLLRSTRGIPAHENDGDVLLDIAAGNPVETSYLDVGRTGGWHYYAIFLFDSGPQVWERSATTYALVPFDFGSGDQMWDYIPEYYRQVFDNGAGYDQSKYRVNPAIYVDNRDVAPNLQLARFIEVLGWGMDTLRTQADLIRDGYDIDTVHANRLALLAAQFGAEIEETAPANVNRSLVRNLGLLYRKRGTLDGIREMVSLTTGWEADVTLGPNLMLSEDQANFVNPNPQLWDSTVQYRAGDRVRYGRYLFEAKKKALGVLQGPPVTPTSNEWWDGDRFVEPLDDRSVARSDTGDISTWQIEGPSGFQSGSTYIGRGSTDPEDETIHYANALAFRNTGDAPGDFTLRSIPRRTTNLTSWNKHLVIESGIPIPRPRKSWEEGKRYRAGDTVMYQGSPYEAKTTTEEPPSNATDWLRLGHDDRARLTMSWYSRGPINGTPGEGGARQNAVITEFDQNGDFIHDIVCNPASYANVFYDPFSLDGGPLANGRVAAKGTWGANGVGDWPVRVDDDGGFAVPPPVGRSYQLAPATVADGNVAITYKDLYGARHLGIVFRWLDANSFWIATQTGVYKVTGGVRAAAASVTYPAFVAGDRMRVRLEGDSIRVFKNGEEVGAVTDTMNMTANRHGVLVEAA